MHTQSHYLLLRFAPSHLVKRRTFYIKTTFLSLKTNNHRKSLSSTHTWHPFVVEKQVEVGDEVEFSRKTDRAIGSAGRYKIRVVKNEKKEMMKNEEKEVIKNEKKEVKIFLLGWKLIPAVLEIFFPAFQTGQYDQHLVVEDENGKDWEFSLRIRRGQYEKPYISQGTWHPFVVEKQAEVDDEAEFSRKTDRAIGSAGRYKIRVVKNEKKEMMKNEEKEVIKNEKKEVKDDRSQELKIGKNIPFHKKTARDLGADNKKYNLFDIEGSKFIKAMEVYSKILTETDVSTRLAVESNTIDEFFPAFEAGQDSQDLVVEDENGERWRFGLFIRQGPYGKPTISAGWRHFVRSKQAKVGDQVVFSKERVAAIGSAFSYKIRVVKQVKPFKSTIGYATI
ncbi:hypothetical protein WN944_005680 [Citrus x changshan-huyou]|uniref:TF-B3 domain-containing protein n=1 Tax=Citrus x changshan-huyou TaxID=2935761 RepID=A0AAP0MMX1_9ROSI